jgi:hypothetical protein
MTPGLTFPLDFVESRRACQGLTKTTYHQCDQYGMKFGVAVHARCKKIER